MSATEIRPKRDPAASAGAGIVRHRQLARLMRDEAEQGANGHV